MAVLRALKGLIPGQVFPLEGDRIVLGRHPDCDIVLEIGAVSRQHARILCSEGAYYVEDLHSRNGTFVNGSLIQGRHQLRESDQVKICDLVFVFHHGAPILPPTVTDFGTMTEIPAVVIDDERPGTNSEIMSQVDVSSSELCVTPAAEPKVNALLEIAQNLGHALGLTEVLERLLESVFKIFRQADRCFVVLEDPGTGKLIPRAVKHRRREEGEKIRISRTICSNVMSSKKAILSVDLGGDSRLDMAESIVDFRIRSMMCAPLMGVVGDVLGIIQVDTLDARRRFQQEDLEVLLCVASQAAVAVGNARLHDSAIKEQSLRRELAVAHEIRQRFLPGTFPRLDGYEFFHFCEPANNVGGDYHDYIRLRDRRVALVVANVAGKGISAALLMAKLAAETRYCLARERTPADAVNCLNTILAGAGFEDRFATLVVAVLDPAKHEVTMVNAGHMAPLLRASDASVRAVAEDVTNLPLGLDCGVEYTEAVLRLEPGESLVLYTDGVTDAMNPAGELYGISRLVTQLRGVAEAARNEQGAVHIKREDSLSGGVGLPSHLTDAEDGSSARGANSEFDSEDPSRELYRTVDSTEALVPVASSDWTDSLSTLLSKVRRALRHAEIHYDGPRADEIQRALLEHQWAREALKEGFFRVVVFDALRGLDDQGVFQTEAFQKHMLEEMIDAFGYEIEVDRFHPAEIAQHLRDEPRSLFCFLNVQCFSTDDFQVLRGLGFMQSSHRVLYCGPNVFLTARRFPALGLGRGKKLRATLPAPSILDSRKREVRTEFDPDCATESEKLLKRIAADVEAFREATPLRDDMCVVCLRRVSEASESCGAT